MEDAKENLAPPPELMPRVQMVLDVARRTTKESKELLPMTHLFRGPDMDIVAHPFDDNNDSKDRALAVLRKLCRDDKSIDLLVQVLESFQVQFDKGDELAYRRFNKERQEGKWANLGEHPNAQDVVIVNVETRDGGWHGRAMLSKDRDMSEIEWAKSMEGRFTGILNGKQQNG